MVISRADSRRRTILAWLIIAAVIVSGCGTTRRFYLNHVCTPQTGFNYHSGRYLARVSTTNCGETKTWDTRVTVWTPALFDLPGTYQSAVAFQSTHDPTTLSLRWESATHLIIEYPAGEEGRVRKALPSWKDVTITHRARSAQTASDAEPGHSRWYDLRREDWHGTRRS